MAYTRWVEPAIATAVVIVLLALTLQVIAPFIAAMAWAGILVFATWQPFEWLKARLWNNATLAAVLLIGSMAALILMPLLAAGIELAGNADAIALWLKEHLQSGLPPLPEWIARIPYVGGRIAGFWASLDAGDPQTVNQIREWLKPLGSFLLLFGSAVGSGVMLLVLSLFFAFFFYVGGLGIVRWLEAAMARIGGSYAQELMKLAGGTVRGVVYGFIGTAIVQGALSWFGFWVADVPNSAAFALVCAFLSLVPGGPSLLGLPIALWLHMHGQTSMAIFLTIWMLAVVSMADNVVKPLVIGKESNLPFVLILTGVLGGALAWGMIGVFLGPTLVAVTYTLLRRWAVLHSAELPEEAEVLEEEAESAAKPVA
ncbi:AI-2E family transporter [Chitinibacteraceae bacterium HSL-7]